MKYATLILVAIISGGTSGAEAATNILGSVYTSEMPTIATKERIARIVRDTPWIVQGEPGESQD
jgi:hypothetical protein